jgi:hypothetical protein
MFCKLQIVHFSVSVFLTLYLYFSLWSCNRAVHYKTVCILIIRADHCYPQHVALSLLHNVLLTAAMSIWSHCWLLNTWGSLSEIRWFSKYRPNRHAQGANWWHISVVPPAPLWTLPVPACSIQSICPCCLLSFHTPLHPFSTFLPPVDMWNCCKAW